MCHQNKLIYAIHVLFCIHDTNIDCCLHYMLFTVYMILECVLVMIVDKCLERLIAASVCVSESERRKVEELLQ